MANFNHINQINKRHRREHISKSINEVSYNQKAPMIRMEQAVSDDQQGGNVDLTELSASL